MKSIACNPISRMVVSSGSFCSSLKVTDGVASRQSPLLLCHVKNFLSYALLGLCAFFISHSCFEMPATCDYQIIYKLTNSKAQQRFNQDARYGSTNLPREQIKGSLRN